MPFSFVITSQRGSPDATCRVFRVQQVSNKDLLSHKRQRLQKNLANRSKLTREQLSRKISRGRKRRRIWKAIRSQAVPRCLTFLSNQLRRKEISLLPTKERLRAGCFWITQQLYTHRLAHRAQKTVIPALEATMLSAFCFLSASPALDEDQNKGWETAASYRPKRLRGHLAQGFQCQLCLQISREAVEETECAPQTCVRKSRLPEGCAELLTCRGR